MDDHPMFCESNLRSFLDAVEFEHTFDLTAHLCFSEGEQLKNR